MFSRESDMAPSVVRWLKTAGLQTKPEFVTPWGICDLVGLCLNPDRVAHRLNLKQRQPVSSITRAAVLLSVPDVDSSTSISLRRLAHGFASIIPKQVVAAEVNRLIADRFVVTSSRGRLQKVNGWMPLQDRLVAVELKLTRIEEALQQAKCNLGFAQESFVAFPMPVARRIASSQSKWGKYFDDGIGLIGVRKSGCETLIPAEPKCKPNDAAIQLYCVEKFWRTRLR